MALALTRRDAEEILKLHHDYPSAQVQIYDETEKLREGASPESSVIRSAARADLICSFFEVQARAYARLVDDLPSHEAYLVVIDSAVRNLWSQYSNVHVGLFDTAASSDTVFVNRLRLRERHWRFEGFRRIATLRQLQSGTHMPMTTPSILERSIGERLDEIAFLEKISHEEQAHRIGIGRTTYFEVKSGHGGRKAKKKTEIYLSRALSKTS